MKKRFIVLSLFLSLTSNFGFSDNSIPVTSETLSLITETISPNECSNQDSKPFKTYSEFGLGSDGKYYGRKSGKLKQIISEKFQIPDVIVGPSLPNTLEPASPIFNLELAKITIAEFKESQNINLNNCPKEPNTESTVENDGKKQQDNLNRPFKKEKKNKYPKSNGVDCEVQGLADSYVLAMSWQPAFCETNKKGKKECTDESFLGEDQYQANNFTLHGLWPNKKDCGINYGFCSEVKQKSSFDAYDALELNEQTIKSLGMVMPSVRAGSHLERHEWYKHGTCQKMVVNEYFNYATQLVQEFNSFPVVTELIKTAKETYLKDDSIPQDKKKSFKIKKSDFNKLIETSLGAGAAKSIVIVCKKDMLVEVNIPLKKDLPMNPKLADLIDLNATGWSRGCRDEIIIDLPK